MAMISCFHTFWSDSKCFTARSTWMVTFPNVHQSVWLNPFSVQKFLHKTNKGYISNFKFNFSWFWCSPFYREFNCYIELEKFFRKLSSTGDNSMIVTEVSCKLKSPSGIFTTFPTSEMNDNVFPRVSWSLFLAIVIHKRCKSMVCSHNDPQLYVFLFPWIKDVLSQNLHGWCCLSRDCSCLLSLSSFSTQQVPQKPTFEHLKHYMRFMSEYNLSSHFPPCIILK